MHGAEDMTISCSKAQVTCSMMPLVKAELHCLSSSVVCILHRREHNGSGGVVTLQGYVRVGICLLRPHLDDLLEYGRSLGIVEQDILDPARVLVVIDLLRCRLSLTA